MRIWSGSFQNERADTLQAAFDRYFQIGTFFPKPADIKQIIAERRVELSENRAAADQSEKSKLEAARKENKGYFGTEEYKQFLAKMKAEHGI